MLNALTFRSSCGVIASGVMAANGRRVSSTILTSRTAYVQQDDLFVGTLTVKEHLLFQAMVRMDRRIPMEQRFDRVHRVINEVYRKSTYITHLLYAYVYSCICPEPVYLELEIYVACIPGYQRVTISYGTSACSKQMQEYGNRATVKDQRTFRG